MKVREDRDGDIVVLEPQGRIDSTTAPLLGERLTAVLTGGGTRLVLDFQHLEYISSAGFRVLLLAAKHAEAAGSRLVLCGIKGKVRWKLHAGKEDILNLHRIYDTLDPGVEAVYREGSETLIIGPHLNMHRAYNRMTIVHESTHAVQDAELDGEWIWRLDKEAIAFVAEWLYNIYASPDRNNLRNKPDPDDPIEVTAVEIARSLADRPGASPEPAAMRRLGDAIYANPTYSVRMLLHPWAQTDGVLEPDFP